jgi:subtilisin family serine protease
MAALSSPCSRPRRRPLAALVAGVLALAATGVLPEARGAVNDPDLPKQWGLTLIGAEEAWTKTTGAGVRIGIVDTGIDLAHEELASKIVAHTSCVDSGGLASGCHGSGQDDHGHGTHVAGIAAAKMGNGKGIAGVAPGASLVVAKAFDAEGSGSLGDIDAAIHWVVDNGARVVNLSLVDPNFLGTSLFGSGLDSAVNYAWSHGAIPVLASGNTQFLGMGSSNYGNLNAVVVGSVGHNDRAASYSSPPGNAKWSIMAPGGSKDGDPAHDVYSTFWEAGKANQYTTMAGTSMAVPHVSGALALLLAKGLTPTDAVKYMLDTADDSVSCGDGNSQCSGRLDVAEATATFSSTPTTTTAPTTTTTAPGVSGSGASNQPPVGGPARNTDPAPASDPVPEGPPMGYLMADQAGRVRAFGAAVTRGQVTGVLNRSIVAMADVSGSTGGYWLVAGDGGIFSFGDARFYGSTGNIKLNQPIVGMASTRSGDGYWLVATDGGIFSFGDAKFRGSTGNLKLNRPIVGMARTPSGKGYWLVASDGGIFSFGDARFFGSTGHIKLNRPIVGMAPTPSGNGYWLVASDGGIFAFGDAKFRGSTGNLQLNQPIVAMTPTSTGEGYWFVAADGGVFNFGDARFLGSASGTGLSRVIGLVRAVG